MANAPKKSAVRPERFPPRRPWRPPLRRSAPSCRAKPNSPPRRPRRFNRASAARLKRAWSSRARLSPKPRPPRMKPPSAFEVSFAAAKDGALAINAKAFEALRANADANFDFLKACLRGEVAPRSHHAPDRVRPQAGRNDHQPDQGLRRAGSEGDGGRRRADQGTSGEVVQARGLISLRLLAARSLPRAVTMDAVRSRGRRSFVSAREGDRSPQRKPCAAWALSLVIRPSRSGRHSSVG